MADAAQRAKAARDEKLEANRRHFEEERNQLKKRQQAQTSAYGQEWRVRNVERTAALADARKKAAVQADLQSSWRKNANSEGDDARLAHLAKLIDARGAFDRANGADRDPRTAERDQEFDRDRDE